MYSPMPGVLPACSENNEDAVQSSMAGVSDLVHGAVFDKLLIMNVLGTVHSESSIVLVLTCLLDDACTISQSLLDGLLQHLLKPDRERRPAAYRYVCF